MRASWIVSGRRRNDDRRSLMLPAPERSRRTLARGALLFRWVALAWMAILAASENDMFRNAPLAWASIGAAGAWTAWLTVGGRRWSWRVLGFDLALCCWLVVASGLVVPEESVTSRAFFATAYPASAALLWAVARGPIAGFAAGLALSGAILASRLVNGIDLDAFSRRDWQNLGGVWVLYLAAGVAVGIVSRLLVRTAEEAQQATDDLVRERERAARLAERESLARQIHDSVLQALALVHKRGKELAASPSPSPSELALLAEIAADQESALRQLILRDPEEAPAGQRSLREALEASARDIDGVPVSVSAIGPIWVSRGQADEIAAAVREALANVAEHAQASRAIVFAEEEDGVIVVSVRDDGIGFSYDEERLRAEGKAGVLKSMKGRIEEMGGRMLVRAAPGGGTEVEFRAPKLFSGEQ
jgi:signal transduction histidine kinase